MRFGLDRNPRFGSRFGVLIFVVLAGNRFPVSLIDPSPTYVELTFKLEYEIEEEPILEAELLTCYAAQCSWDAIRPTESWTGGLDLTCSDGVCTRRMGFFPFDGYLQILRIKYPDRVRVNNPFGVDRWHPGEFTVTVRENDLKVSPDFLVHPVLRLCLFLPVLLVTIVTEITVAAYIGRRKQFRRIPGRIAIANLFTLPVVWLLFPTLGLSKGLTVLLSESFAVAFEALFIRFTKSGLDGRSSLILSLGMNGASFILGLVIFGVLSLL